MGSLTLPPERRVDRGNAKQARASLTRCVKRLLAGVTVLTAVAYGLLLIPDPSPAPVHAANAHPFAWRQDERWRSFEERFETCKRRGCAVLQDEIAARQAGCEELLAAVADAPLSAQDPFFSVLEEEVFEAGVLVAACPDVLARYARLQTTLRSVVKRQSEVWDCGAPDVRGRLYRLLYGSRAALEETMLQAPANRVPALVHGEDEPSVTPSATVLGVTLHSGDILVSRGGAPTSALIARSSDFPGNFSHIALAHVDPTTGAVSLVEAHIERGVVVSSLQQYLADTKLRIEILRPRADLPAMLRDPSLPHRAAMAALEQARLRHIPYDFAMDLHDHRAMFCSEVASAAYEAVGVRLWSTVSTVSSPGAARWLAAFGVTHFETEEPSDLEYDPQLRVVAEWRDPRVLWADHIDNAVVDAMLEAAERGEPLGYDTFALPLARVAAGYSRVLNRFGRVGPVPEGMSATTALRNRWFSQRHSRIKRAMLVRIADFEAARSHVPPYWELVRIAREAAASVE